MRIYARTPTNLKDLTFIAQKDRVEIITDKGVKYTISAGSDGKQLYVSTPFDGLSITPHVANSVGIEAFITGVQL